MFGQQDTRALGRIGDIGVDIDERGRPITGDADKDQAGEQENLRVCRTVKPLGAGAR